MQSIQQYTVRLKIVNFILLHIVLYQEISKFIILYAQQQQTFP